MMFEICRSMRFHCTWPVGFIIMAHFNEVASDGDNRITKTNVPLGECRGCHQMV